MKRLGYIILIAATGFLSLFPLKRQQLEAATQTQVQVSLTKEQAIDSQGLAFRSIKGWEVEKLDNEGIVGMRLRTSNSDVIAGIMIQIDEMKDFPIGTKRMPFASYTPEALFDSYFNDFIYESAQQVLLMKEKVVVDSRVGYVARFKPANCESTECYLGDKLAVIKIDDSRFLTILGISQLDKWQYDKEYDAVLNSIRFFQPHLAPTQKETPIPSPTPQPKNGSKTKQKIRDIWNQIKKPPEE